MRLTTLGKACVALILTVTGNLIGLSPAGAVGGIEVVGTWGGSSTGFTGEPPTSPVSLDIVAIDTAGNIYQVQGRYQAITKVTPDGTQTVFAGRGTQRPSTTPTPATSINLGENIGRVALDDHGNLYITANQVLLKVDRTGMLTLVAGGGDAKPSPTPTPATDISLTGVSSLKVGPDNSVYMADISNGVVVRVDPDGMLAVVAGGGTFSPSRFPTPATDVDMRDLGMVQVTIAFAPDGSMLLADSANNDIYRVASGMLQIIGNDPHHPNSIAVSPTGAVFLGSVFVVRRLTPSGTVTDAVDFGREYSTQIAFDDANNLYATSLGEDKIWRVQDATSMTTGAPNISGTPMLGSTLTAVPGTWSQDTTFTYQWRRNGQPIVGATASTIVVTREWSGSSIAVEVTGSNEAFDPRTVTVASAPKAVPTFNEPGTPAKPSVSVNGAALVVRWAPSAANGAPIRTYVVRWGGPRSGTRQVAAPTRATRIPGLPPGRYAVRVAARNDIGTSAFSAPTYRYR